jgi:predicted membrane-bound spermidine synthase
MGLSRGESRITGAAWPGWTWPLLSFVASGATLVLELVAGRLLSPLIGVSLYTWTAIIGVMLAGVSLGSWLGGRLADRHPGACSVGSSCSAAL